MNATTRTLVPATVALTAILVATGSPGKQPRERNNIYLAWIRRCPCVQCGTTRGVEAMHIRSGYPEAGWPSTGMQTKPSDFRTAPGCAACHRDGPDAQHRMNERAWWERLGIYPPDLCAALQAAFLAGQDGAPIIHRFTREGRA